MTFDTLIDRRGTNSAKWDAMETVFGVSPDDGLGMWVADMDFAAPDFLQDAVKGILAKANYGYFIGDVAYREAVAWWMQTRHNWKVEPDWMFTTFGLGNAIAIAIQALTGPDDHVAIMTPVYHEFPKKIARAGRGLTELALHLEDGVYRMDFDRFDAAMTGRETMLIISSPHNPAGRVWSVEEQKAIAAFCEKHDLVLIADEIHHDLVMPGFTHVPMHVAAPEVEARLIMMTSASKTFNIAGARTGCVTIPDAKLRAKYHAFYNVLDMSPNLLGQELTRAAYSPAGAEWVDQLMGYIAENDQVFARGVNAIPGVTAMPMQSTYLAWVDFADTGMTPEEIQRRVFEGAKIAATPGHSLGKGGETFMRFNIGTQRAHVNDAVGRLQAAFADLQ